MYLLRQKSHTISRSSSLAMRSSRSGVEMVASEESVRILLQGQYAWGIISLTMAMS